LLFQKNVVWALVAQFAPQCPIMHSSITQISRKANPATGTGNGREFLASGCGWRGI
jgi:hypothetical protein